MPRLPAVSGRQLIAAFAKVGFVAIRQRESHVRLRHADGRTTTVPVHSGETLGPGLLLQILRDCELTRGEFIRLL